MIKLVHNRVWAFDLEWVPDARSAHLLIPDFPEDADEFMAMEALWAENGGTLDKPRPFLRTVLCRIVSMAFVERLVTESGPVLRLVAYPDETNARTTSERDIVEALLKSVGSRKPQLVGFNSVRADLKILIQRGFVLGVNARGFCERPEKPWLGVDYFSSYSDHNIDMSEILGGYGGSAATLHQLAVLSGIPGKMGTSGDDVVDLWLEGEYESIIRYNEFDAFTTYLVWLRLAHFAGCFTSDQYQDEQALVMDLLVRERDQGKAHLQAYIDEWNRLRDQVTV
jgi:3'-5' exonuclease